MRHQLWVFTGQVLVVEDLAFFAGNQTRLALDTGDQSVAVSRHREPGEWPELGSLGVGRNLGGAFEANDRC